MVIFGELICSKSIFDKLIYSMLFFLSAISLSAKEKKLKKKMTYQCHTSKEEFTIAPYRPLVVNPYLWNLDKKTQFLEIFVIFGQKNPE